MPINCHWPTTMRAAGRFAGHPTALRLNAVHPRPGYLASVCSRPGGGARPWPCRHAQRAATSFIPTHDTDTDNASAFLRLLTGAEAAELEPQSARGVTVAVPVRVQLPPAVSAAAPLSSAAATSCVRLVELFVARAAGHHGQDAGGAAHTTSSSGSSGLPGGEHNHSLRGAGGSGCGSGSGSGAGAGAGAGGAGHLFAYENHCPHRGGTLNLLPNRCAR